MYKEIKPTGWSSQYIDAYWTSINNSNEEQSVTIVPDGCTDIVLSNTNSYKKSIVGCMSKPQQVTIHPSQSMFGIRFKPGCAAPFLNTPMKILQNVTVETEAIRDIPISDNIFELLNKKELLQKNIEAILKKLFIAKKFDTTVYQAAIDIKQLLEPEPIEKIAYKLNISRRQLERKFLTTIGISPKLFSRITRFQKAKSILTNGTNLSLASLALDLGYYDQAHFCKEFKEFNGKSPLHK